MSSIVPQESVLGPLLFNMYVNDVSSQVKTTILQFADNLKMFHVIHDVAMTSVMISYKMILKVCGKLG